MRSLHHIHDLATQAAQHPERRSGAESSRDESPSQGREAGPVAEGSGLRAPPAEHWAALREQFRGSFLSRRRLGRRGLLAGFVLWALFWMLVLAALSELSLRQYPEHWCENFGLGSVLRAVGSSMGVSCAGYSGGSGSPGMGVSLGRHWASETYGFMLRVRAHSRANLFTPEI